MRRAALAFACAGCATAAAAPPAPLPAFVTRPDAAHPRARWFSAVGVAPGHDLEGARAGARRAVAEQVQSALSGEVRREVTAWSGADGEGVRRTIAADVTTRTRFSHAELIEIERAHVVPASGMVYALAVLDRARAAAALGADLGAAEHRLAAMEAAVGGSASAIERLARLRAARGVAVAAAAIALELGAMEGSAGRAAPYLARADDLGARAAELRDRAAWRLALRAEAPDLRGHIDLVEAGIARALRELGFALVDGQEAAVLAEGAVRGEPWPVPGGHRCRVAIDLVAREGGETVVEVHRDRVETHDPQPSPADACRLALSLLADAAGRELRVAIDRRIEAAGR